MTALRSKITALREATSGSLAEGLTFTKKEIKQIRQIAGAPGQALPVVVFPGDSPPQVFGTAGHWSPGKADVWRKSDREVRVGREWCAAQGIGTLEENSRQPEPASKLRLGPARVDEKGTASLRKIKKLPAKNQGDLNSALMSAGYYAQKMGHAMHVYSGNSYGHSVWRVSDKPGEFLNMINNTGSRLAVVTPELEMVWHDIER
jgi:hypothetical protein